MEKLPGSSPVTKAGRFGGDARLSYKGGVNNSKVDKGRVESGARLHPDRGALTAPSDPPCGPLGFPPPEPPGFIGRRVNKALG